MTTPTDNPTPLLTHLLELRSRLLNVLKLVALLALVLSCFSRELYHGLAIPLLRALPNGSQMIATDVTSPFLTPFKLAMLLSVALAMPYILHQLWTFVAPGLYRHERRLAMPLLLFSILLFYVGIAFAYWVVSPLALGFFSQVLPVGVTMATDITSYLDFELKLFMAFGLAFEIPVLVILLCWSGVTSAAALASKRPYVIVLAFVLGMLMSPPDVLSQTLLALPMWWLFEIGVLLARCYQRPASADIPAN